MNSTAERLRDLQDAKARETERDAARKAMALSALRNGSTMDEAARLAKADERTVKRWAKEGT